MEDVTAKDWVQFVRSLGTRPWVRLEARTMAIRHGTSPYAQQLPEIDSSRCSCFSNTVVFLVTRLKTAVNYKLIE